MCYSRALNLVTRTSQRRPLGAADQECGGEPLEGGRRRAALLPYLCASRPKLFAAAALIVVGWVQMASTRRVMLLALPL
jgi:hypothetical protein